MGGWPEWWRWDTVLSEHVWDRMADRGFNEVDLLLMLEGATGYHRSYEEGRFVVETRHDGEPWRVVVEPESDRKALVVVTAYRAR